MAPLTNDSKSNFQGAGHVLGPARDSVEAPRSTKTDAQARLDDFIRDGVEGDKWTHNKALQADLEVWENYRRNLRLRRLEPEELRELDLEARCAIEESKRKHDEALESDLMMWERYRQNPRFIMIRKNGDLWKPSVGEGRAKESGDEA
ncbi:uncharacterized protein AB675_554 [Cyphellophora attinorum]|uniref:Uncharacterized protein n=1 Tax=Cyphellophora attinorum TaxID=1664694 RepID=A0A0N1I1A3_9EURO|nr:uncharacterized protein AB675_554 [Phialophora attinorum]KPI45574.1 hypothetical protein AB675_554 [Phialophora attinorum]